MRHKHDFQPFASDVVGQFDKRECPGGTYYFLGDVKRCECGTAIFIPERKNCQTVECEVAA